MKCVNKNLIFLVVFLVLISGIFLVGSADGFIEVKKYKVINSEKVCGDKLCSKIDEERAKKGMVSQNIAICGDRPCNQIEQKIDTVISKNNQTPLGQYNLGVSLDLISCQNLNHVLILRAANLHPACVKSETIPKLIQSSWALGLKEQEKIFLELAKKRSIASIEDIVQAPEVGLNITPEFGLNITPDFINDQRYLVFEGYGWHRLHNVEITISNELGEIVSVRSKTTDHGGLYMPWPVPKTLPGGFYHVLASDGIHFFEMDFPITHPNQTN